MNTHSVVELIFKQSLEMSVNKENPLLAVVDFDGKEEHDYLRKIKRFLELTPTEVVKLCFEILDFNQNGIIDEEDFTAIF